MREGNFCCRFQFNSSSDRGKGPDLRSTFKEMSDKCNERFAQQGYFLIEAALNDSGLTRLFRYDGGNMTVMF